MRSGVLCAPHADLAVTSEDAMSGLPVPGRSAPGGVLTPPSRPHAVIAGAPRSGKSSLVNALIEAPGCTPVDMAATAAAWLVFRHGERPAARAFIPGHREPRPIGLNGRRLGENAVSGREGQSRPPRRIEISYPADLLTHLSLVDTPGVDEFDIAAGEVVLDAAGRGCGLIFVFDAAAPLTRVQLDLLSSAMQRVRCVALVLTKIDRYDEWPDVLAANRASLVATDPRLAGAPWFPVALDPVTGVFGVAELRHLLATWAADRPAPPPAPLGGVAAATVSSGDKRWQALLDREILTRRVAAVQRVSIDLATTHVRCVQELGTGQGCPELPYVLDRSLHALSVRASRQVELDTAAIIDGVFAELLDAPPGQPILARIAAMARRTVDGLHGGERERHRAMLITTTSAVAAVTGPAAVDSLAAVGLFDPAAQVLPAISVGLTANCFSMWRPKEGPGGHAKNVEKKNCRRWLQQALRVVEVEMERELVQRYDDLRQALAIIAADAVDHGVLLA